MDDRRAKQIVAFCMKRHFDCQQFSVLTYTNEMEEAKLRMRRAILAECLRTRHILKTGTEWEILFQMDEQTFYRHLRITHSQFDYTTYQLTQLGLNEEITGGPFSIPLRQKVVLCLWYLANGNGFREMSDKFNLSQSSVHKCVLELLSGFCKMVPFFVSWPTICEKTASSAAFNIKCGIQGIIGAINGCHIKIQRPLTRGVDYLNRKNYYSVVLQAIVDETGRFRNIFVGASGKVHDARILRKSKFFENWKEKMGRFMLLGDSAYIGQAYPFIMTPKRDNRALTLQDQMNNSNISSGRVVVEQAFGRLKCKWRRLRDLQNTRLDVRVGSIICAQVLEASVKSIQVVVHVKEMKTAEEMLQETHI